MGSDENYQNNAKIYDVLDRTYFRKAASSPAKCYNFHLR